MWCNMLWFKMGLSCEFYDWLLIFSFFVLHFDGIKLAWNTMLASISPSCIRRCNEVCRWTIERRVFAKEWALVVKLWLILNLFIFCVCSKLAILKPINSVGMAHLLKSPPLSLENMMWCCWKRLGDKMYHSYELYGWLLIISIFLCVLQNIPHSNH